MLSCVKQRWSLSKYEQKLKRYYAEEYYVHQGRYYLSREQYRKGNRFYAVPGWVRDHVNDERRRRKQERQARREAVGEKVRRAVANGTLKKPRQCEQCQRRMLKREIQAHHRDYRRWRWVAWLCQSCHIHVQGKLARRRAALYAERRKLLKRVDAGQITFEQYCKKMSQLATELRVRCPPL